MKVHDLIALGTPSPRIAMPLLTALTTTLYGSTPYLFLQGRGDWAINPAIGYDGRGIEPAGGAPRTGSMQLLTKIRNVKKFPSEKLSEQEREVAEQLYVLGLIELNLADGKPVERLDILNQRIITEPYICSLTKDGERFFQRFMEPQINLGQLSALWSGGRDTIWR